MSKLNTLNYNQLISGNYKSGKIGFQNLAIGNYELKRIRKKSNIIFKFSLNASYDINKNSR